MSIYADLAGNPEENAESSQVNSADHQAVCWQRVVVGFVLAESLLGFLTLRHTTEPNV